MHNNDSTHSNERIAIIGGGVAGMAAALKAVECGTCITLIEHISIGGTFNNRGGIPSAIMTRAAKIARQRTWSPFDRGITAAMPSIDRLPLLAQQQQLVDERLARYEAMVENSPEITLMRAEARFLDGHKLIVRLNDDSRKVSFRKIRFDRCLIATGSISVLPPIAGLGDTPYWTSTEALRCLGIPARLLVVGASPVTLELTQAFARLGSSVTLLVQGNHLIDNNPEIDAVITETLISEGVIIQTATQASEVSFADGKFLLHTDRDDLSADRLLVDTESIPNTHSLCLDFIDMALNADGQIIVDDHLRTNVPDIYAAGSCTDQPGNVSAVEAAGRCAAINLTGGNAAMDMIALPTVTFTDPPIATVGLSETEAQALDLKFVSYTLSLEQIPCAQVNFNTCGFIRIIAEADSLRLLGVQAVAPEAGELIQTAAMAIRAGMSATDISEQIFPQLTMVEGLRLCAQVIAERRNLVCTG